MRNVPERGSDRPCVHCAIKHKNEHTIRQSGECDGIKNGDITGTAAMNIRQRNSGKGKRRDEE